MAGKAAALKLDAKMGFRKKDRLVFLDLEGAEPNYVDEVGVVVCDLAGEVLDRRRSLGDPGDVEWQEGAMRITGITPDAVKGAPSFREVWDGWLGELLASSVVVCHDVQSDMTRLNRDCFRYGITMPTLRTFDTLEVARECVPGCLKRGDALTEACRALGIKVAKAHRADADAESSRRLFREAMRLHPLPFSRLEVGEFVPQACPKISVPREPGDVPPVEVALFADVFGQAPAPGSVKVAGETVLLKGTFAAGRGVVADLVEDGGGTVEEQSLPTTSTTLLVVGDLGYIGNEPFRSLSRLRDKVKYLRDWGHAIRVVPEASLALGTA